MAPANLYAGWLAIFAALADPNRRRILQSLRQAERAVGELAQELGLPQPAVSKHLKVLRESGFVSRQVVAQRRVYRLDTAAFEALDAWMTPYRRVWHQHLDALTRHLDGKEQTHGDS